MIADTITKKIGEAMKAKDEVRLSTLRMLSSALNYEKIAKQHTLSVDEELAVVKKETKIRSDSIESFKGALGKQTSSTPEEIDQKIKRQEQELAILKEYLPEEIDDQELEQLIDSSITELGAKDIKDMGKVIGAVKAKVGMRADGSKIAQFVKNKLV